eukprot:m.39969 g.39969  ORF g.39969 m.39969 type:complete len:547 (+) comp10372_c1_seq1:715-2355(+)
MPTHEVLDSVHTLMSQMATDSSSRTNSFEARTLLAKAASSSVGHYFDAMAFCCALASYEIIVPQSRKVKQFAANKSMWAWASWTQHTQTPFMCTAQEVNGRFTGRVTVVVEMPMLTLHSDGCSLYFSIGDLLCLNGTETSLAFQAHKPGKMLHHGNWHFSFPQNPSFSRAFQSVLQLTHTCRSMSQDLEVYHRTLTETHSSSSFGSASTPSSGRPSMESLRSSMDFQRGLMLNSKSGSSIGQLNPTSQVTRTRRRHAFSSGAAEHAYNETGQASPLGKHQSSERKALVTVSEEEWRRATLPTPPTKDAPPPPPLQSQRERVESEQLKQQRSASPSTSQSPETPTRYKSCGRSFRASFKRLTGGGSTKGKSRGSRGSSSSEGYGSRDEQTSGDSQTLAPPSSPRSVRSSATPSPPSSRPGTAHCSVPPSPRSPAPPPRSPLAWQKTRTLRKTTRQAFFDCLDDDPATTDEQRDVSSVDADDGIMVPQHEARSISPTSRRPRNFSSSSAGTRLSHPSSTSSTQSPIPEHTYVDLISDLSDPHPATLFA